jgi:hypothetical protein
MEVFFIKLGHFEGFWGFLNTFSESGGYFKYYWAFKDIFREMEAF